MTREFEQRRHADSLVLLDLPSDADWTADEAEMAISLAATICVEQTRSSSGSRFVLGIAADSFRIIASRSPGGFREEALDALAECQPASSADLNALLQELVAEHPIQDERLILITPRPSAAAEALQSVSETSDSNSPDLVSRTTIVTATVSEIGRVFQADSFAMADERNSAAFRQKDDVRAGDTRDIASGPAAVEVSA